MDVLKEQRIKEISTFLMNYLNNMIINKKAIPFYIKAVMMKEIEKWFTVSVHLVADKIGFLVVLSCHAVDCHGKQKAISFYITEKEFKELKSIHKTTCKASYKLIDGILNPSEK